MALPKHSPITYVPEKDIVQERVSAFKDNQLKMLINKGTELRVPIWHSGMHEASLTHVGSAREAITKKGYFKSYKESSKSYADQRNKIKQLKSQLLELDGNSGQTGLSRKSNKNVTTVEVSATSSTLRADIMAELKQAAEAVEEVMARCDKVDEDMFQLYMNLLSINARYVWNKIVQDRTNSNLYTDLQGFLSMAVLCSMSSPCSPTMRLSRRGTTSKACSRNPSTSTFVSLQSVCSSATPTSHNCPAGTTARA